MAGAYTEARFRLSTPTTSTERPLRADARRNRERVLQAARDAFAETGLDAQMDEIARRAGVGVGTVYRHFPTKDALIVALADAHFGQLADIMEAAGEREGEPTEVLIQALWDAADPTANDSALCEVLSSVPLTVHAAAAGHSRLEAATDRIMVSARAAGTLRQDARVEDVRNIMCGFGHIAAQQRAGAPLDWRRYLTIALDGLRAR